MPRFAAYKQQQILSEDYEQQEKNTAYYLRLEIEEAKILKSWKILQGMPSEAGDQSQAIMYRQDLPSMYLYVEKSVEEVEDNADSSDRGCEVGTIRLWDTGTYKTSSTITEQLHSGKLELSLAGAKLYGRFSLAREPSGGSIVDKSGQKDKDDDGNGIWHFAKEYENDEIKNVDQIATKLLSQRHKATLSKRHRTAAAINPQRQQEVLAQSSTITTGFPRMVKPMLATPVDEPFDDDQWVFEFKWDGVRSILF